MSELKFERITDPADPERCQAGGNHGQCPYKGVILPDGTRAKYCPRHGGNKVIAKSEREETRLYLAAQWREKIGDQADHPKFKSLREEVGILRMMLDNKLEQIKDNVQLMLQSQSVSALIQQIRDTLKVCQHIELSSGQMLDKNQALQLVTEIADIVSKYVTDPDTIRILADEMLVRVQKAFK